jgi:subtilisin family serine protease
MSTIGGRPFDHDGHGTHMAALAVGKNCGVAPGAGLAMASCPLDRNTASPGEITSQLFAGVEFLLSVKRPDGKEGVDIINLSLGVEGYSSLLRPTIRQVRATGDVLVIAAVGNRGPGKHDSPADYGGVQSIGAIDSSNLLWENTCFARYGRHKRLVPQYVAPGVGVWSAQSGGDYNPRSGTSIASALASGVAAVQIARRIAAGSNVKKCSWSFSHERLRHQGEELRKILL